ncbi:MAG: hypothetical protein CM15mV10_1960 [uncultured marine virus]|nr:MAG: hypothetical protein CM15mV10_1960 [uncultured marine virus]
MPIYPVINNKTGEKKELNLTMQIMNNGERTIQTGIRIGMRVVHQRCMVILR